MKIKRTINGQEVEIELTGKEIQETHREYVTDFMQNTLEQDFHYSPDIAKTLSTLAYQEYCKGNGLTEYECIEKVADNYEEDKRKEKKFEYAVEIRKTMPDGSNKFMEQIDVFQDVEEAKEYVKSHNKSLNNGEFFDIVCVEYDVYPNKHEEEIESYSILHNL